MLLEKNVSFRRWKIFFIIITSFVVSYAGCSGCTKQSNLRTIFCRTCFHKRRTLLKSIVLIQNRKLPIYVNVVVEIYEYTTQTFLQSQFMIQFTANLSLYHMTPYFLQKINAPLFTLKQKVPFLKTRMSYDTREKRLFMLKGVIQAIICHCGTRSLVFPVPYDTISFIKKGYIV